MAQQCPRASYGAEEPQVLEPVRRSADAVLEMQESSYHKEELPAPVQGAALR